MHSHSVVLLGSSKPWHPMADEPVEAMQAGTGVLMEEAPD